MLGFLAARQSPDSTFHLAKLQIKLSLYVHCSLAQAQRESPGREEEILDSKCLCPRHFDESGRQIYDEHRPESCRVSRH